MCGTFRECILHRATKNVHISPKQFESYMLRRISSNAFSPDHLISKIYLLTGTFGNLKTYALLRGNSKRTNCVGTFQMCLFLEIFRIVYVASGKLTIYVSLKQFNVSSHMYFSGAYILYQFISNMFVSCFHVCMRYISKAYIASGH